MLAQTTRASTFRDGNLRALGSASAGSLGLPHLEVKFRDRLEREYDIDPDHHRALVIYHVHMRDGTMIELHNPADMPDLTHVDHIEEPRIKATILVPDEYLGDVLKLCPGPPRRTARPDLCGAPTRHLVVYDPCPHERVVLRLLRPPEIGDKGYASFDYQMIGATGRINLRQDAKSWRLNERKPGRRALHSWSTATRAEKLRGRAMLRETERADSPATCFKIPVQGSPSAGASSRRRRPRGAAQKGT